ncbi:MAG: copper-binding protein [Rhodocyclaceae bacterium]|nr:copper-binding protein [Rhodocyclaceae bacterium]
MTFTRSAFVLALLGTLAAGPALADSSHAGHGNGTMAMDGAMADGLVRKVDKAAGKLTIKHGPLKALNMPPMTMVFRVASPELLDGVKAGDKVKFVAQDVDGALTVTELHGAK